MEKYVVECVEPESSLGRILKILKELDRDFIPILSEQVNVLEYAKKIAKNAVVFFLTFDDEDCGECSIYLNRGNVGFITSFAIKGEMRGTGVSDILMDKVIDYARKQGFQKIGLQVSIYNRIAQSFYLRKNFQVVEADEQWITMEILLL